MENMIDLKENFYQEEDRVNHPNHYEGKYECIEEMIRVFGKTYVSNFCMCNAFKYIWRWQKKNGYEDIRKADWYLTKCCELLEVTKADFGKAELERVDRMLDSQGAIVTFNFLVGCAFDYMCWDDIELMTCIKGVSKFINKAVEIYDDYLK